MAGLAYSDLDEYHVRDDVPPDDTVGVGAVSWEIWSRRSLLLYSQPTRRSERGNRKERLNSWAIPR